MTDPTPYTKIKPDDWSNLEEYLKKNLHPVSPSPVFIKGLQKQLQNDSRISLDTFNQTGSFLYPFLAMIGGLLLIALWVRFLVRMVSMRKMSFQTKTSIN
jgi:hypothetical protein